MEAGATTFQIFTRNPNQWRFKPLPDESVSAFKEKRRASGFRSIVDHMPYLPNLSSPKKDLMKISRYTLEEELKRCDALGIDYLVVHLGSHLGEGTAVGVRNVAEACSGALRGSKGRSAILLENMAGQKNSVGSRFEDLRSILDKVDDKTRMGVCFDSCHAFASGFDLTSAEAVDSTFDLFEEIVGFDSLKVVHFNDSKGPLGGRLDRHEFVGEGKIGAKGMKAIMHYPGLLDRPIIMETPYKDVKGMKQSLAAARRFLK